MDWAHYFCVICVKYGYMIDIFKYRIFPFITLAEWSPPVLNERGGCLWPISSDFLENFFEIKMSRQTSQLPATVLTTQHSWIVVAKAELTLKAWECGIHVKMTHQSDWSTAFPSLPGCDGNGYIYFHLYIFAIGTGDTALQISPPRIRWAAITGNVRNPYIMYGGLNFMVKQGKE